MFNITNIGAGDSTAVGPLEFDIMSNGKPTITPPSEMSQAMMKASMKKLEQTMKEGK